MSLSQLRETHINGLMGGMTENDMDIGSANLKALAGKGMRPRFKLLLNTTAMLRFLVTTTCLRFHSHEALAFRL